MEKVLGIYTPERWHEFDKPERRCSCGLLNKEYNKEYSAWWRKKQKIKATSKK